MNFFHFCDITSVILTLCLYKLYQLESLVNKLQNGSSFIRFPSFFMEIWGIVIFYKIFLIWLLGNFWMVSNHISPKLLILLERASQPLQNDVYLIWFAWVFRQVINDCFSFQRYVTRKNLSFLAIINTLNMVNGVVLSVKLKISRRSNFWDLINLIWCIWSSTMSD